MNEDDLKHAAQAIALYRNWLAIHGLSWPNDLELLRQVSRSIQHSTTSVQECPTSPQRVASAGPFHDDGDGSERQLLTGPEAAERLAISHSTLRRLRARGDLPYVTVGRRGVRFRPEDIAIYIEQNYS